jgi:acetylornithine/succinyldiaminopimelate/putrescine aminotransferase
MTVDGGGYEPLTKHTIALLSDRSRDQRANMLFASLYINPESAKLAYLLHQLVSSGPDERWFSFFANSTWEAVSGAIKLARHTAAMRSASGLPVLIVDPAGRYQQITDPLAAGDAGALVPGLIFTASPDEALAAFDHRAWAGVLIERPPGADPAVPGARELLDRAREMGVMTIVSHSLCGLEQLGKDSPLVPAELPADVHVFGESLAGWQVPFGCFTMSRNAHKVWNTTKTSSIHTSTFGGNGTSLACVLDALDRSGYIRDCDREVLARIDADIQSCIRYFRRHVNPNAAAGMETFRLALDIGQAQGSALTLRDGERMFDLAGGTGACMRGHNPADLAAEVLDTHDTSTDYHLALEERLSRLSGLPHALPAVSGATAVDAAVTMALLGNSGRPKIVTFTGNYSGKTLLSMNLSRQGPLVLEPCAGASGPYYQAVEYIDPFSADAEVAFRRTVAAGDVGLVWFEAIQGMNCVPLPLRLIETISELREQSGYFIGVDEVLTGVWRTSGSFLLSQGLGIPADVVSLAKPLSDMTLPIGVALVSDEVFRRASENRPAAVERLSRENRCQIGAHIAWHALERVTDLGEAHATEVQKVLTDGLADLVRRSSIFESVKGQGMLVRLVPARRWFPFRAGSQLSLMMEMALSDLIRERSGALVAQLRFFPAIFADVEDLHTAMRRLADGLDGCSPLSVYRHVLGRVSSMALSRGKSFWWRRRRTWSNRQARRGTT